MLRRAFLTVCPAGLLGLLGLNPKPASGKNLGEIPEPLVENPDKLPVLSFKNNKHELLKDCPWEDFIDNMQPEQVLPKRRKRKVWLPKELALQIDQRYFEYGNIGGAYGEMELVEDYYYVKSTPIAISQYAPFTYTKLSCTKNSIDLNKKPIKFY